MSLNFPTSIGDLDPAIFQKIKSDRIDIADLESFGLTEEMRLQLEDLGMMPKPIVWDSWTGHGLSWSKQVFQSCFFKEIRLGRSKKHVLRPKTYFDWFGVPEPIAA